MVVGIRERSILGLATVGGASIELADVQGPAHQMQNSLSGRFRDMQSRFYFRARFRIEIPSQPLPGDAAACKTFGGREGLEFHAAPAANALSVIQRQQFFLLPLNK